MMKLSQIDPTTLFQRITIAKKSDEGDKEYRNIVVSKLCPSALLLLDDLDAQKGSVLIKAFRPT